MFCHPVLVPSLAMLLGLTACGGEKKPSADVETPPVVETPANDDDIPPCWNIDTVSPVMRALDDLGTLQFFVDSSIVIGSSNWLMAPKPAAGLRGE